MLLAPSLVLPFFSSAQTVEDVVTGLTTPSTMSVNGSDLYFIQEDANTISKIDLSQPNPTPT